MMNVNIFDTEIFPYMEGEALVGLNITLTISGLKTEKMQSHKGKEEEKFVLYFKENKKGFVLNKTNAKRIAQMYGPATGKWEGKQITITTEPVQAFGELHNALRVVPGAIARNGNGEMTLDKLFSTLNSVKGLSGFYRTSLEILDCRRPSAILPEADDTDGWRVLFVDARDHALGEIRQAVETDILPDGDQIGNYEPEDAVEIEAAADQAELFSDDPPADDADPGAYETT